MGERLPADFALVRLLVRVDPHVVLEVALARERLATVRAVERPHPRVQLLVRAEAASEGERREAHLAPEVPPLLLLR